MQTTCGTVIHAEAELPRRVTMLFAVACGFSVANVYFAHPLLDVIAADFGLAASMAGGIITATQAGCALALLLLVPLGDRVDRKRLTLTQVLLLSAALALVSVARTPGMLLAGMLATGMLGTAMTQGLIAYASVVAPASRRGSVVGVAQGGVFVGLLLARVVSGAIADVSGWRSVYLVSAMTMLVLAAVLWWRLPVPEHQRSTLSYPRLIASMLSLLWHDRVLQIRGMLALLMFAVFNIFWSALVFPLTAAPFGFSHSTVGAFGIVGAVGAFAAMRAGAWADRGLPMAQCVTAVALVLLVLAWLPLSALHLSLWALVAGILLLDIGGQAIHVTNQSLILRAKSDAAGRVIGAYMLFYSAGSGLGSLGATAAYAMGGWQAVCALGASVSLLALAVWRLTLRWMPAAAIQAAITPRIRHQY